MSRRIRRISLVVVAVIVGLVLAGPASGPRPDFPPRALCVEVLDVGQGDAVLLELPGGERWLIDGGGDPAGRYDVGRYRLLPALRRAGVERLDAVFATHGDGDHVDGLHAVLSDLPVGGLWISGRRRATRRMRSLVDAAERRGVPVFEVEEGAEVSARAPAEALLLHPLTRGWEPDDGANERSIVLRVALGRVSFLLTGDIESPAEVQLLQAGGPLRSTVIKVPHHASRTSSTEPFVARVDPLVAVAGIGADNRFGFPHASVARRYLTRGTPLYWTGRHGALRSCTDGFELRVQRRDERGRLRPLRRWDERQLADWESRGRLEPPLMADVSVDAPPPPRRSKRRRRRAARADKAAPSPAPPATKPAPEEAPELLDDREWERRRRRRGKLRPPW